MLWKRTTLALLTALLVGHAPALAADGPVRHTVPVAAVFDLGADTAYGRFGRSAMIGLEAGSAEWTEPLGQAGLDLEIRPIDTRAGLDRGSPAIAAVDRFLSDGGRLLFGAATTGDTNRLLAHLVAWGDEHLGPEDEPILLFAPVSTSVLVRGEARWSNQESRHVYLFRIAVSDEQALRQLFSGALRLRYDLLGDSGSTVSPGSKTLRQNLVLFLEASFDPADDSDQDDPAAQSGLLVFDDLGQDELDGETIRGRSIPAGGYTRGFLENLHLVLDKGYRRFVRKAVFWDPSRPGSREALRAVVEEVVRDPSVRGMGIVGYADFVAELNGVVTDVIARTGLSERAAPTSLWRFTGGTVKLEHLQASPGGGSGSLDGIHFLRTVPSEGDLFPDEREILEQIVAHLPAGMRSEGRDLADQVDDHTLHAYLGWRILAETFLRLAATTPAEEIDAAHLRQRLQSYDPQSVDPSDRLEVPFFPPVEFTPEGDIRATRHVFFVRGSPQAGYKLYQTDLRLSRSVPFEVVGVLALGFVVAVFVLINWRRLIGTRRRKVGQLGVTNPYIYGVPVTKPEMYFGRREDFRKIVEEIASGPFVRLITGGRRSGKSSFLHFIVQGRLPGPKGRPEEAVEIPDRAVPIYVDLQKLPNYPTEAEVLHHLIRAPIEEAVRARGLDLPADDGDGDNGYFRITKLLELIHRREPDWMILLLFDEIELLNERMSSGGLSRELPRLIRSWVQGTGTCVSVIFTGSPLDTFAPDLRTAWAPVSGIMKTLNLGPISESETKALASEPLEEEVVVDDALQQEIFHLSGGQPFFCQAICHMAVNALNIEGVQKLPAVLSKTTVEAAVQDFVENTPGHVDDMWSRFRPEEQYLLLLMARRVERRDELITVDRLLEYAVEEGFSVGDGDGQRLIPVWKRTLETLSREKRFIAARRDDPSLPVGQEGYTFGIDLMRYWLRRKQIWPVIDALETTYGSVARSQEPHEQTEGGQAS